jgi:hypothetical protein
MSSLRFLVSLFSLSLLSGVVLANGPVIEKVDPSQGFVDEDTEVTITGEGFETESRLALLSGGPVLAVSYETPGSAWGVVLAGDYAYVADGSWGGAADHRCQQPAGPRPRRKPRHAG